MAGSCQIDMAGPTSLYFNDPRPLGKLPTGIVLHRACRLRKTMTQVLDLGRCHGHSVLGEHLSEVLWKGINLLLQEEKGCTDGTQLPFVYDKGEFLHRIGSAF
jgi:hypothetical protein